jgi:hypothetical protein
MSLEKEIRQAFQEHVIRGRSFMVSDIRNRVETLLATDPPGGIPEHPADYEAIKAGLLALIEKERPVRWALTTIPVVNSDGTPTYVWQFTPTAHLDSVEQMSQARLQMMGEPRASILQRILDWGLRR